MSTVGSNVQRPRSEPCYCAMCFVCWLVERGEVIDVVWLFCGWSNYPMKYSVRESDHPSLPPSLPVPPMLVHFLHGRRQ